MQKLSPMRFGVAIGIAGSVFYAACVVFMATVPIEIATWLSNSLMHGVDTKSIIRESVPLLPLAVDILCMIVAGLPAFEVCGQIM